MSEAPNVSSSVGGGVVADGGKSPGLQRLGDMAGERAWRGALGRKRHQHGSSVREGGGDEGFREQGPSQTRVEKDPALCGDRELKRDVEGRLHLCCPPAQSAIPAICALHGALERHAERVVLLQEALPLVRRV